MTGTAGARGRFAAALVALIGAALLAGCTVPPQGEGGAGNAGQGFQFPSLRPLARQPALPPGAPPLSAVPSVRYDLAVSGADELTPDDGVPGDDGPREIFERGGASWYGIQFHQRKTANGERFDMTALTAAHRTLPFNTRVCVRSLVNGREVLVRVNDRGPFAAGRIIDLSRAAAEAIGMLGLGIKQVALSIPGKDTDRCGGVAIGPADTPVQPVADAPTRPAAQRASKAVPGKTTTRSVPPRERR